MTNSSRETAFRDVGVREEWSRIATDNVTHRALKGRQPPNRRPRALVTSRGALGLRQVTLEVDAAFVCLKMNVVS